MSTYQTQGLVIRGRASGKTYRLAIEVVIDVERLDRELAERALHNKSGRTQLLSGLIKAKIIRKEKDL